MTVYLYEYLNILPLTCKTQWPCICTSISTFCLSPAKHNDHVFVRVPQHFASDLQNTMTIHMYEYRNTLPFSSESKWRVHLSKYLNTLPFTCKTQWHAFVRVHSTRLLSTRLLHLQNHWPSTHFSKYQRTTHLSEYVKTLISPAKQMMMSLSDYLNTSTSPAKQMMTHMSKHMNTFTSHGKQMTIHLTEYLNT